LRVFYSSQVLEQQLLFDEVYVERHEPMLDGFDTARNDANRVVQLDVNFTDVDAVQLDWCTIFRR
jgi:hypothetical protein